MQDLDNQVLEHLGDRLFTIERMAQIVRQLSQELAVLRQANSARHAEIQAQLIEVRQRIRRQYEAIESGAIEMTLVAARLRELKEIEDGLVESLTQAAGPAPVPLYLFKESSLQGIQDKLKRAFLSPETGVAKSYVNHLLERIEVAGDEVRLDARMANVLTIEAEKRKDGTVNHEGQSVPSIVLDWLPDVDSNHEHTG
jgi:DNA-binding transcriptional MerR regulator